MSEKKEEQDPEKLAPQEGEATAGESEVFEEFELPEDFHTADTQALVERAQGGDTEALNHLFAQLHDRILDAARRGLGPRLRLKESPEDLAQTTFREATRDFGRYEYRGEDSLIRWLVRILQNKIRDKAEFYNARKRDMSRERAMHHRPPGEDAEGERTFEPPSPDPTVSRQVSRSEEFEVIREALQELSDDHRKAITLVFFQGMTLRQAGEQMEGRSEDAVRMMLRRAEKRLREITKKRLAEE